MLKEVSDGIILSVIVTPNARETKIVGVDEARGRVKVNVAAPPVKGKANKELMKFFKKLFGAEVVIVRGETSKEKDLLIKGINKEEVIKKLKF
ncbi:MAG: uncharacterized protein PWP39_160 [Pyrococcus sp.]|uniref:DUF167 family protein n=1 Tax=Pyrococcus sp. TaxID=33866 RepID=UPI00259010A0|nr:DUF167 family protein [Pyrococcus sp.]MDK2868925.1 uncharacterized protein [Pyrococcus sp.]